MRTFLFRILSLSALLLSASGLKAQITSQPASLTLNDGTTATFAVAATGATSYQWKFNGTNLSDGATVLGSTSAKLILSDLASSQAGTYTVVVNGSATSQPAVLTLLQGTIIRFTFTNLQNLPGAPSNTVDVELFDHDKPLTVQNFVHYVESGAYGNMFYHRLLPNYILQGGGYAVSNVNDTTIPVNGWSIEDKFVSVTNSAFPLAIESEFGAVPIVSNTFGTLSMALSPGSNTANCGFYFNLANNTNLDTTNLTDTFPQQISGPYTVFGRIINGTNVLQVFNTLTTNVGIISQATGGINTNDPFVTLPVAYIGSNAPANTNLIFAGFNFLTTAPTPDTIAPTINVSFPAANTVFSQSNVIHVIGTVTDNGIVAGVNINAIPIAASDGTVPDFGYTVENFSVGTSNWDVALTGLDYYTPLAGFNFINDGPVLEPGQYNLAIQGSDSWGNKTAEVVLPITVNALDIQGSGTILVSNGSRAIGNPVGYPFQLTTNYTLRAVPDSGYTFARWEYGNQVITNPLTSIVYNGGVFSALFVKTNAPRNTKGIVYTYPASKAKLITNSFTLKGRIVGTTGSTVVSSTIFSVSTGVQQGSDLTTVANPTWAVTVSNLPPDDYLVQTTATNASGFSAFVSETFSVIAFKGIAGVYNGLFVCDSGPVASTNSGYVTLTLAASGAITGKLEFPAYPPVVFHGTAPAAGKIILTDTNIPNNPFQFGLNFPLTNETELITGRVVSINWESILVMQRQVLHKETHTAAPGRYVLDLDPGASTNYPSTNGYASVNITANSTVAVAGEMPDGATFTEATTIGTNGVWPFYTSPAGYKYNGMLLGWMTNSTNGSASGELYWFKTNNIGKYYLSGVNTNVSVAGTTFAKPAGGSTYAIVFGGGTLTTPITNTVTVNNAGQFVVPHPAPEDKLAISLAPTGVLTGHFYKTGATKPVTFNGAFMNAAEGGWGFFLDENAKTGYFTVTKK